jgi:hypothetical protein
MSIGRRGEIDLAEGSTLGTVRMNNDEWAGLERRDASPTHAILSSDQCGIVWKI